MKFYMIKKMALLCGKLIHTIKPYKSTPQFNIAIVAIIKNEGDYIKEWAQYHRLIGVDHIFLYNNGSTDDTANILSPYITSGFISFMDFPGIGMQLPAYNDALKKYGSLCKYMAFIDADEFIYPVEHRHIIDVLDEIMEKNPHAGGVAVNWRVYGSSGHISKPSSGGGIIELPLACQRRWNRQWLYKKYCKTTICLQIYTRALSGLYFRALFY